jgi:hypothetical protein
MISKWFRAVLVSAMLVPAVVDGQVGLTIDNELLFPLTGLNSDLDAPIYVIAAGFAERDGNPAIRFEPSNGRLVMQTRFADLTCEYFDASGQPVAPPGGSFLLELDRIPTPLGGEDPNIDFNGQPIVREFPLDVAAGASITQMFLVEGPLLDICSSAAGCSEPPGIQLRCRQAGTAVFNGDFEPIVADLTTAWSTSPAGDPAPFDVVAGDPAGTVIKVTASNAGSLDVADVAVDISALLPPLGLSCPQVVTAGTDLVFDGSCFGTWTVGDLEGGASAEIELRLVANSTAPLGESMTLEATVSAPGVADANPGNDTSTAEAGIVKVAELLFGPINSIPSTAINLTNPPAQVSFSIPLDPSRGPSVLNEVVEVSLQQPSSGNFTIGSSDADFDAINGVWTRSVGTGVTELTGSFTVDSFEPGSGNFCFGIDSIQAPGGTTVFISADSVTLKCLDVIGPESVDLGVEAAGPASIVAGSAPAGGNPANLAQTLTLTNNNAVFDARELSAEIRVVVPASAGSVSIIGDGSITQDGGDPELWIWDVGTLLPGASADATVFVNVPASAADGALVTSSVGNATVAGDQNLVDPLVSADVSSTISREYDLSSLVVQALPKSGAVTAAAVGGGPANNLAFVFAVQHAQSNASDATGVEAQVTVTGPGGLALPVGTVVLEDISVPPGDASNITGLNGDWDIGTITNAGAIAPQATVTLSVFQGVGNGAEVCVTGAISVIGAGETDTNPFNDSSGEICVQVVDGSSP